MSEYRLQKYLARAGVASRRACETLILEGRVSVNGQVVSELGTKVDSSCDEVRVDGELATLPPEHVTLLLHKPAGFVTTMSDPQGRRTVAELVPVSEYPGLFPVGRLDTDTTGLLLFTNDGELGNALLHPRKHVEKRYLALVEGKLTPDEARTLEAGIELTDGKTLPAKVRILRGAEARHAAELIGEGAGASGYSARHGGRRSRAQLEKTGSYVEVVLREGRKRQVRRMLEAVDHPVIALHRASLGSLQLEGLDRGAWRELTAEELAALRKSTGAV